MTNRWNATIHDAEISKNDADPRAPHWPLAARALTLFFAPIALLAACGAPALRSAAVTTTAAHASAGDDADYGYQFETDSAKNATLSPASALSLPHAAGDRIPPETIQAILRGHYGAFSTCYQAGLSKDPKLSGVVSVKFVAGSDGITKEAVDDTSSLPDKDVIRCVVDEFGKIAYPHGGGMLTVAYPIQFAP